MKAKSTKDPHRIFVEDGHLIDEALRRAGREAILQHKKEGLPLVIYRDGKTVWVHPDEFGRSDRHPDIRVVPGVGGLRHDVRHLDLGAASDSDAWREAAHPADPVYRPWFCGMRLCSQRGSSPSHDGFCAVPSKMDDVLKGSNS